MFDIPESDIVGVRVDEESVKTNKNPEYIRTRAANGIAVHHHDENAATTSPEDKISIPTL